VVRSVENSRFLLRAAITGISGIVDTRGRIRAESRPDELTTLTGKVALDESLTAWTRWGFWIPRASDLAALGVLIFGLVRLRRRFSGLKAES
jgi:apolipoprotein N-acyltransferase